MDDEKKEIIYTLGSVYETLGDKQKAYSCYLQIFEADINYKDIKEKIQNKLD